MNHEEFMQESLWSQGISLMIYGMGTVFVFLAILIVVTSALSKIVSRFFPEAPASAKPIRTPGAQPAPVVEPAVLAAIKAAIEQHRAKRR